VAVRLEFDSLEKAPEALREALVEVDGRFVFEAEPVQDVTTLKTALQRERDAVKKAKQELGRFKDIDPERYAALLQAEHDRADAELKAKGQVDELIAQRLKRAQDEWTTEKAKLESAVQASHAELDRLQIDGAIMQAAPAAGVEDSAIDLVTMLARQVFQRRDGKVVPIDQNGNIIPGIKDVTQPMTMAEWFSDLAKQRPILFRRSTGGGAAQSNATAGGTPRKPVREWTAEEKREFVDKNGLASWERLVAEAYANPTLPGTPAAISAVKH